ncbi:autotransporter outer membrane beta-barrel domain-containing protein [Pragia fontium]|nr:autotransporter outer membrane beta-barrel domain-containing protein [Pragia fontium]
MMSFSENISSTFKVRTLVSAILLALTPMGNHALAACTGEGLSGSGNISCSGPSSGINVPVGEGVAVMITDIQGETTQISGDITLTQSNDYLQVYSSQGHSEGVIIGSVSAPSNINMGDGDDIVTYYNYDANGEITHYGDVDLGAGNDRFGIENNSKIFGNILAGSGNDIIKIGLNAFGNAGSNTGASPEIHGNIFLESGRNFVDIVNKGSLFGNIVGGVDSDSVFINDGIVKGDIDLGDGDDEFIMVAGTVDGTVRGGDGSDTILIVGGHITGDVDWGAGNDGGILDLADARVDGSLYFGDGDDDFVLASGTVNNIYLGTGVNQGIGNDKFLLLNGQILGGLYGGQGNDTIEIQEGEVNGVVDGGDGDNLIMISGGTLNEGITTGSGNDQIVYFGGEVLQQVATGAGDDYLIINGNRDIPMLDGGDGQDTLELNNITTSLEGGNVRNWETLMINQSNVVVTDNTLSAGNRLSTDIFSTEIIGTGIFLNASMVTMNGFGQVNGDLSLGRFSEFAHHGGIINGNVIQDGRLHWLGVGDTLTVNGNYTGEANSHLIMNTRLGDDASLTDRLVINGNTAGSTMVKVINAGGSGAYTLNGIELIQVNGQSDGTFIQDGRIVAGAYDYSLVRGQEANNRNWYLTNKAQTEEPDPGSPRPETKLMVRPEAASYASNLAAANQMFITRLHDRLGETQYVDALTGEKKVTSLWLRQTGGHNRQRDSSGELKTRNNRYVAQLGGDIASWAQSGQERLHLGVMAGYGHSSSNTNSNLTKYGSRGAVNGYSTGIYSTWYANDETHQGTYVDSWLQYAWFTNYVNGQGLYSESYHARGFSASLETGYTHQLGVYTTRGGTLNTWYIQPQAQVIWTGIKVHDYKEANGTKVQGVGDNNIQTRLGLRTFLKGHSPQDDGKQREFQPFIEVNWIHNIQDYGARMDGVMYTQKGTRNLGEIKIGVEGQISSSLNLWGNVGEQIGAQGYSDTAVMVGVKLNF